MEPVHLHFVVVVNCRVGSLEIEGATRKDKQSVNCRVGSLENCLSTSSGTGNVNCRVGSLEI